MVILHPQKSTEAFLHMHKGNPTPALFATGVAASLVEPDTVLVKVKPPKQPKQPAGTDAAEPVPEAKETYHDRTKVVRLMLQRQLCVRLARRALNYTIGHNIEALSAERLSAVNTAIDTFFMSPDPDVGLVDARRLSADQAYTWIFNEVALTEHNRWVYAERIEAYRRENDDILDMLSDNNARFNAQLKSIDEQAYNALVQLREIIIGGIGPIRFANAEGEVLEDWGDDNGWFQPVCATPAVCVPIQLCWAATSPSHALPPSTAADLYRRLPPPTAARQEVEEGRRC